MRRRGGQGAFEAQKITFTLGVVIKTITSVSEMQKLSQSLLQQGKRIGFVPTMGFLHEGHLSLVDVAKKHSDVAVMSIFVNPTQFGPNEDYERYPRDAARDQKLAQQRGVDYLWMPEVEQMYPAGEQTKVVVTELTRGLCGPFRPGHFMGVATVVAKLFHVVQAQVAVFGEKDFQQLQVIRRMVKDLLMPIEIIGVPTLRDPDGLAMSSRNVYLNEEERKEVLGISQAIQAVQALLKNGETQVEKLLAVAKSILEKSPHLKIEYLEIVDKENLEQIEKIDRPARILIAAYIHQKRFIDNGALE